MQAQRCTACIACYAAAAATEVAVSSRPIRLCISFIGGVYFRNRRISIFGHVRRLQGTVPAHEALRLAVNTRAGRRPDATPEWKRPRGRPRQTWIRQLEVDVGLAADAAWDDASDRDVWRAQRPVAGQAVQ